MSTTDQIAAPVENSTTDKTNEVHDNGVDKDKVDGETPSKVAKLDENEGAKVKRRSSGRQKKSEEMMLAEARAVCGDIDTSAGRSMRKRPDPPKVEEKKKPVQRTRSKKGEKAESKTKDKDNDSEKEDETKSEDKPDETSNDAADSKSEETAAAVLDEKTDVKPAEETTDEKNGTKEQGAGEGANGTATPAEETPAVNNGGDSTAAAE